ncbi:YhcN/YlaJ family sporulation lipoprotein [Paenibacillus xerothermodurans]|uniref:YhcN/YlaJ family sporulation lipoprotein n=1 Tax=Paenibacillus xerothermodurans TaxID=1977292 RepID=A0A2W1P4M6_PAEXE|nr:YhcN/YlaJ family sporulation lipoprotein [Paenibacillus xerothermodurans]PZE22672.1 YhcN/YlaJ family sporulation lipoprotein [Paenibacillus xerothermodurans]
MRIFIYCILMLSMLAGCNADTPDEGATPSPEDSNGQVQVQQTAPGQEENEEEDAQALAERLEQIATTVPQVESANCVVFGKTAVVGLDLPADMDRTQVGSTKLAVAEALRKDRHGVNALVTADMDLAERIRQISEDVGNGAAVGGFADEMAQIIGRIMPQYPNDVTPIPPPDETKPDVPRQDL